jgi:hypothetical protein
MSHWLGLREDHRNATRISLFLMMELAYIMPVSARPAGGSEVTDATVGQLECSRERVGAAASVTQAAGSPASKAAG